LQDCSDVNITQHILCVGEIPIPKEDVVAVLNARFVTQPSTHQRM